MKIIERILSILPYMILMAFSFVFASMGISNIVNMDDNIAKREQFNQNAKPVEAIVTGIERKTSGRTGKNNTESTSYDIKFTYEVEGIKYEDNSFNVSTNSYDIEEIITVYYDSEEPSHAVKSLYDIDAYKSSNTIGSWIFAAVGSAGIIYAIVKIIGVIKK